MSYSPKNYFIENVSTTLNQSHDGNYEDIQRAPLAVEEKADDLDLLLMPHPSIELFLSPYSAVQVKETTTFDVDETEDTKLQKQEEEHRARLEVYKIQLIETCKNNDELIERLQKDFNDGVSHEDIFKQLLNNYKMLQQRQIKFIPANKEQWTTLYDKNKQPITNLRLNIAADKGFNYSYVHGAFINQKRNTFQITASVDLGASTTTKPTHFFVNGILKEIASFKLALSAIKPESPSEEIFLRQANSERKLKTYHGSEFVKIEEHQQCSQITISRLHFSETTFNNAWKKGKPNPDQKYFKLMVKLQVYSSDGSFYVIQEYISEKIIVMISF